jgi:hypothetical protein
MLMARRSISGHGLQVGLLEPGCDRAQVFGSLLQCCGTPVELSMRLGRQRPDLRAKLALKAGCALGGSHHSVRQMLQLLRVILQFLGLLSKRWWIHPNG